MDISDYSPAPDARRFDAGTPPVPNIYAGLAGMGIVDEVGVAAIEPHVRGLADRLLAGLDELGATVATPRGEGEYGPLVCVASTDAHALVEELQREKIVTSERDANLRISLHLYNVEEDIDRILEALAERRQLLSLGLSCPDDRAVHTVGHAVGELHLDVDESHARQALAVLLLRERTGDAADVAPALGAVLGREAGPRRRCP